MSQPLVPSPPTPGPSPFPILPIVTLDAKPLTKSEKYGSFYYLGLAGLAVVLALVSWFGYRVWRMSDLWTAIYVLHEPSRPLADRIRAGEMIAADPRLDDTAKWEMALRINLPREARYRLAEGLDGSPAAADPAAFAAMIALGENWPAWLRRLGARQMALAAIHGARFPTRSLDLFEPATDPVVRDFVDLVRTRPPSVDRAAIDRLEARGSTAEPDAPIARALVQAIQAETTEGKRRAIQTASDALRELPIAP